MSQIDKVIGIHSAAIASGKIMAELMQQGAVLIDGQATSLLPPAPPDDPNAPKPVVDAQTLDAHEHPYDHMARETKERFPHCHQEIDQFFKVERLRNQQENQNPSQIGDSVSRSARSMQWAYFWEGIKKLEIARHNEEVHFKRQAKKLKKGKTHARQPKPGFNGPTYG